MTSDGLHLHVGGYRRQGDLSPSPQGPAYHQPAALMYILCDVWVDGEQQAPNADVAWPEPLRPQTHAPTPVWLVTTDNQCAQAAEQAQRWAKWVMVQVGAGQPRPRGLPRGTRKGLLVRSHLCLFLVFVLENLDDFPKVKMSPTQR